MTADKTGHQSGTDATSSGVQSPDRIPRAHSVAGRQPSYAQPTVASLLRMSRSNDLLDGGAAVPMCPRCRPREFSSIPLIVCQSVCLSVCPPTCHVNLYVLLLLLLLSVYFSVPVCM